MITNKWLNTLNVLQFRYKLLFSTIFLSKLCELVTSPLTTYACKGAFWFAKPSAIWLEPLPATKLNDGADGAPPPEPPFWALPLPVFGLVPNMFLTCTAVNAPAKPACINGYAGNAVVIGEALAVWKAFCTPWNPDIVACATATPLPKALSFSTNWPINAEVWFAMFNLAFSTFSC